MGAVIRVLLIAVAAAIVVVLLGLAWLVFVNANALKPQIEGALAEQLNMQVDARGDVELGLLPRPHVTLHDVLLRNGDNDIGTIEMLWAEVSPAAWWRDEFALRRLRVTQPRLDIVRAADGTLNIDLPEPDPEDPAREMDLIDSWVSEATVSFRDAKGEGDFDADGCSLRLERFELAPDAEAPADRRAVDVLRRLQLQAELECDSIRVGDWLVQELRMPVSVDDAVIELAQVGMRLFNGVGTADVRSDFSNDAGEHHLDFELREFGAGRFLNVLALELEDANTGNDNEATDSEGNDNGDNDNGLEVEEVIEDRVEGTMNFQANLTSQGVNSDALVANLSGGMTLDGEALTLFGINLDEQIAEYEDARAFDLLDAAALLFVGPLAMVATRVFDFASVFGDMGEQTRITEVLAAWRVENGVVYAEDVAIATEAYRLAAHGRMDFVEERFREFVVGVVNEHGCAVFDQEVEGSFDDPDISGVNVIEELAAPILERLQDLFNDADECEDAFYAGAVSHPEPPDE